MGDGCSLSGRPGGSDRCGSTDLASSGSTNETTADLSCHVELPASEGSRSGDRIAGALLVRSLYLE